MEAKYNPETTDTSLNLPTFSDLINRLASRMTEDGKLRYEFKSFKCVIPPVIQTVSLPKLCTIETYDELIKYVEEMYVNGMILGDEFVMKPSEEQRLKLINSTFISLYGHQKIGEPCGFYKHWQDQGFVIETNFGVKIIIK
jgi:hypothetical protein